MKSLNLQIVILSLLYNLSTLNFCRAQTDWTIILSTKQMQEKAIQVSLEDLKNKGTEFGLAFTVVDEYDNSQKQVIIVGNRERSEITKNLIKRGEIKLKQISDPEGYEIITQKINGKKTIIVAGGSVLGDVYGLYWIRDRIRVYKTIPVINIVREPTMKIRYSRTRVRNKDDINRALRYGLNLVYGENPLRLIPWNSEPEKTDNEKEREQTRYLIDYAHSLHLKYFTYGTDFTYHPKLLKKFAATLSPSDPLFWEAVQEKYRSLLQALPELDGIATFTGEEQMYWGNYKTFDPMHEGENCDWSLEKRYRTFVKKVHEVVVGEFDKVYHHRTWITNCFEQQARPEVYKKIFIDEVPMKNLYLIPSFTQNDRWWHQRYNPTFNVTPHNMLAVMEQMNYYESSKSNLFPTYPGIYFQAGLESLLSDEESNLKGLSLDLRSENNYTTGSLTAYTVFRLGWNYFENPKDIVEDFCAIHFGKDAAKQMAELYMLSPVAYKYGLFIEPVSYGDFNSLIHMRVGTFPAHGYPSIDKGKEHIKFLRKIYYRCKPWIPETIMYLDHGLNIAEHMSVKYDAIKSQIIDTNRANELENSLRMMRLLIKTNNLYVKTFFSFFEFMESSNDDDRKKLAKLSADLKNTRTAFMTTTGFGYKLFGVNQLIENVDLALEDQVKAKRMLKILPDSDQIEKTIDDQQQKYKQILNKYFDKAVKILHWEARVDGRDIIKIHGDQLEIEHLRWDSMYFKDFQILNPLPKERVTVIPKDILSRPMHPFILQQPSVENNYTVKVYLYDVPAGAGWCKFDLYYIPISPNELGLEIIWD